jgi:integrase
MFNNNLTDLAAISYLLSNPPRNDEKMTGTIRTKEKCPKCNKPFEHFQKVGFICKEHKTVPQRFFIDIYFGKQIKIYSHKSGLVLSSYDLAVETLKHIQYEIRNKTFDPSKYVKAEISQFQCDTLIEKFLRFKGVIDVQGNLIRDGDKSIIAPSYRKDYKRMLEIAKAFFKGKDVRELRKAHITEYWQYLQDNFNYSNKTIKNVLDLFKTFLNYTKEELEYVSIVPAFPDIEVSEHQFKWFAQQDQIEIFAFFPDEHKPIIAFLCLHGSRPAEARALRCKHVDMRTETITIIATWSGRVYREKRKGKKSKPVTIPINSEMKEYIIKRLKNNLPNAYLFVDQRGTFYTENKLRRIWNAVRIKANLDPSIRLYDFTRHSFATNLFHSGTPLLKIKQLMGHSSIKMTEKYTHADVEHLRADLNKLTLKTIPRLSPKRKSTQKK